MTVGDVRIGLTGAAYDDSVRASDPGDLTFRSSVATVNEQAAALRREGADFVVAVAHITRDEGDEIYRSRAADLVLTGHTHDLFIDYDGRTAMVEVELRRALRHLRSTSPSPSTSDGASGTDLVAAVPRDRHRDGDARSGGRGRGRGFEDKLSAS